MQEFYHTKQETYAFYTGQTTDSFIPHLAGITYPDPSYRICCPNRPIYVFEYVISGSGHIEQGHSHYKLHAGDAYILHAGQNHHYYSDSADPWTKIWFNVDGSLVSHLLSDYGLEGVTVIRDFQDGHYIQDIIDTMTKDPVCSADRLALLLHTYLQALALFLKYQQSIPPAALTIRNYIDRNLTVPLSIEAICDQVGLSRSRVLHLFREVYHVAPYQYYMNKRLKLAQSMLLHTTLSISEIAAQLGFLDYHHFSGFFKKHCGMSPAAYRKNHNALQ